MSLQNTPDAWWKTGKIFNFRECLCAWCTICTYIFSIFCVQILFWCWFSATIIKIVSWISIPAAKRHLCVQFVFQFSIFNFSGEEAGDQSGGAAAADTISTPCPQHTSLRDSLDQKRVPENFVFWGEIFIHVYHFRDSFNQRGASKSWSEQGRKIPLLSQISPTHLT